MESLATGSVLSAADWLGELQEGQCLQVGETLRALTLESGPRIEFGAGGEVCELLVCIVRGFSECKVYKQKAAHSRVLRNLSIFGECSEAEITMKRKCPGMYWCSTWEIEAGGLLV